MIFLTPSMAGVLGDMDMRKRPVADRKIAAMNW
jgi:hypothetical protein